MLMYAEVWDENRMRRDWWGLGLTHLTYADVCSRMLTYATKFRWGLGMTHLTSLSLKGNFLTTLPELISRLQVLSSLVASADVC